jgi:glucokinase
MWVLAGDIGGTKTDLALYHVEGPRRVRLVREEVFPSREYGGLEDVVRSFLHEHGEGIAGAAFGVAGPVLGGEVALTNLPWKVEAASLEAAIGCRGVRLMNDLETTAYGALFLDRGELETLNEGIPRETHRVVIAAGTGLGQAILFWDGERYRPTATEGGHVDFAPRDEREMGLLRFLLERYGRVSYERVLSGPGLLCIFDYLTRELGAKVEPSVRQRMEREDPSAVIGESGVSGACATCEEAVEMFVSLYGAQAANLALTTMALGGVYVGGGIVTKLLPKVKAGGFMEAFRNVGRFEPLLAETPVRVILNPKTSLLGAAEAALDLALERPTSGARSRPRQ